MSQALRALLSAGIPKPEAIDAFLAQNEFPLIEGDRATFVYRGEADEVEIKHWIYGLAGQYPMTRVAGTDLWHVTVDIPRAARIEYKVILFQNGKPHLIRDPLNHLEAYDPFGSNSVVTGAGYEIPDWTEEDPESRKGDFQQIRIQSRALGRRDEVKVYTPARFRETRRYPLLIIHDGEDYLNFSSLKDVLDNLIERLEIAPMVAALIQSPARLREYAADPSHAEYVATELLPRLEKRYPILPDAGARGLMGASFGAVASLSTAWRHPGVFGRLLLQSGSFAFADIGDEHKDTVVEPVVEWMNDFREKPGKPSERVYISCGTYEPLIYENRSIVPVLQDTGMEVKYIEARDGHNWQNWRDRLREGMSYLYPGPLWMVYE